MRVVTKAAFRRPEDGRVLHPVAGEHFQRTVVAAHRHGHHHGALGVPEALGDVLLDVGVLQALLELRDRHAEKGRIPLESCLFDVQRHGPQSLGGFPHDQKQLGVEPLDHDLVARVGALLAARPPQLTGDADPALRPAGEDHHPARAGQRLGAGDRLSATREPEPEPGLGELEDRRGRDERDSPARRQPQDGDDDCQDEEQRISECRGRDSNPHAPIGGQLILSQPRIASFATPAGQG